MKDIKTLLNEANSNDNKTELTEDNLLAILSMAACMVDDDCPYEDMLKDNKLNPTLSENQVYSYAKFLLNDKRAQKLLNSLS